MKKLLFLGFLLAFVGNLPSVAQQSWVSKNVDGPAGTLLVDEDSLFAGGGILSFGGNSIPNANMMKISSGIWVGQSGISQSVVQIFNANGKKYATAYMSKFLYQWDANSRAWNQVDLGIDTTIATAASVGDIVLLGGDFNTPYQRFLRWDGADSTISGITIHGVTDVGDNNYVAEIIGCGNGKVIVVPRYILGCLPYYIYDVAANTIDSATNYPGVATAGIYEGDDGVYLSGWDLSPKEKIYYSPDAANPTWSVVYQFDFGSGPQMFVEHEGKYYIAGLNDSLSHHYDFAVVEKATGALTTLNYDVGAMSWPESIAFKNDSEFYLGTFTGLWEYSTATGFAEIAKKPLEVFPNPAGDCIKIAGLNPEEKVECYDALGRKIGERSGDGTIPVADFPEIFFLKTASAEAKVVRMK